MLAVEGPLIVEDDQRSSANEHSGRDRQRQIEDSLQGEPELCAVAPEKQVGVQKPQRVAETVPPEVDPEHGKDNGVNIVDVGTKHLVSPQRH